jgi:hypothetical protein
MRSGSFFTGRLGQQRQQVRNADVPRVQLTHSGQRQQTTAAIGNETIGFGAPGLAQHARRGGGHPSG